MASRRTEFDCQIALGARRLQEFEARRGREEQIAHLDPGARGMRCRQRRRFPARLDHDLPGALGIRRPRGDPHPADRADRRQRLAAEAERVDAQEVVLGQFRGAVPLDRQDQFFRGHAGAIVGDRDQCLAAFFQGDVDARGAGVDRVLDQLLDRRSRPLDDFAGSNAVDEDRRQQTDRHPPSLR